MSKKFYLETYGCQMNVHDSEKASAVLAEVGYTATPDPVEADFIVLNTCMVREKAARKVFSRINDLKQQIRTEQNGSERKTPAFGVMGCVAQAEADRLFERSRDIKLVIGTQAISRLPQLIEQLESGISQVLDVRLNKDQEIFELDADKRNTPYVAFVTITEGCNKFCSYCIVPFTRGRERSRPADRIVEEARSLARQGFKEIHLLGQNVNSYGLSAKFHGNLPAIESDQAESKITTFARLLERVAVESGLPRIKYTTSYPRDFDGEIVRIMDRYDNLCEWIHLPVQSGSNAILRAMRRGYTREEYLEKIAIIRKGKKDYSITGDIIVGFPGETEEDFSETMSLVAEVEYDGLYIFKYSPRPRTPAAALTDNVPEEVIRARFMRLQELQDRIQRRRYERYLGKTLEVLVEGVSPRSEADFTGHTRCNKVVNFRASGDTLGDLVTVRVTDVKNHSLYGEPVRGNLSAVSVDFNG